MTVPGGDSISNERAAGRETIPAARPPVFASEGIAGELEFVTAYRGAISCQRTYRSRSRARLKSTDKICNGPPELSDLQIFPSAQRFCGPSRRLHSLPPSAEQASAQRSGGSQVRSSRQSKSLSKQCADFLVSGANSSRGGVEGHAPSRDAAHTAPLRTQVPEHRGLPDETVPKAKAAGVESCPREANSETERRVG